MHKSVLVVEDDKDIRDGLSSCLSLMGVTVIPAKHGQEALEILSHTDPPPCLILLDLMMPIMDGWQFRNLQKQIDKIANVPVVVITADGNAIEKARKMDAFAGLRKPLDLTTLFNVVKTHCG